jgi:hypothetical protein
MCPAAAAPRAQLSACENGLALLLSTIVQKSCRPIRHGTRTASPTVTGHAGHERHIAGGRSACPPDSVLGVSLGDVSLKLRCQRVSHTYTETRCSTGKPTVDEAVTKMHPWDLQTARPAGCTVTMQRHARGANQPLCSAFCLRGLHWRAKDASTRGTLYSSSVGAIATLVYACSAAAPRVFSIDSGRSGMPARHSRYVDMI